MKLGYRPKTLKQLKKLPKREKRKVISKIETLATNPYQGKPLKGEYQGIYSLRAWPYRILYEIQSEQIIIYSVEHRQGAYK